MANDKNKLDDFKLDDLDFEFDSGKAREVKDDRSAIRRLSTSFAQGAAETLTSSSTIKRFALSALPRGYATAINTADEAITGASELYNIAAKEIKPAIPAMRRATQKALPKVRSYLPKTVAERLQKFADHKEESYRRRTQADFDEDQITASLSELTRAQLEFQAESQAKEEVRKTVRERVEDHQRLSQLRTLESIQTGIGRLVGYQDQITNQFQRKSLELQYRQYFVQRDTLRHLMERGVQQEQWEKAMLHNSALPDQAKLKLSEAAHANFRDRLLNGMQLQVANFMGNYTKKIRENLARNLKEAASTFAMGVQSADDIQQAMAEQRAMGLGDDEDDYKKYGKMAGSTGANFFAEWLAGKVRKGLDARSKPGGLGEWLQYTFRSIPERLNRYAQSPDESLSVGSFFESLFKESMPRYFLDNRMGPSGLASGDQPATFDNLTRRSIIEVIPGYLSRIHQELAVANNGGQPVDRLVFNYDRGKFDTSTKVKSDIKRKMFDPGSVYAAREGLNEFVDTLVKDRQISDEDRKSLMMLAIRDTASGMPFDIERYSNIVGSLQDRFQLEDGKINYREYNDVTSQFLSLRNRIPDAKQMAGVYNEAGYGELLEEMGLVDKRLSSNRYNYDKAFSELLTDAEASESVFAKRKAEEAAAAAKKFDKVFDQAKAKASETFGGFAGGIGDRFGGFAGNMSTTLGSWMDQASSKLDSLNLGTAARNAGTVAMETARSVGSKVEDLASEVKDIYVKGRTEPVIQAVKMRAGEYFDQITGNPIQSLGDIKGPVVNTAGEVVLSASDIANNLMDQTGRKRDDIVQAVRANVEKLAETNLSVKRMVGGDTPSAASGGQSADPTASADYSELVNLNSQQVELLKVVVTILSSQGVASGNGPPPGKIRGFLDNMVVGGAKKTWGGIKLFGKAYAAYIRGIGKAIGGVVGGAGRALGSGASLLFNKLKSPLESYRDVYVKGEKQPALTAAKMRRGHYQNVKTRKVIKGFKDIQEGPIADVSDNGAIVLTEEQIKSGIYVASPNGLVRVTLGAMGGFAKTVIGGYFNIAKLPFAAVSAAAKGLMTGAKMMFNDVVDVYVKTDLKTPRLRAMLIKNGRYYNAKDGKVITGFKSINGAVKQLNEGSDKASATDIEVLSLEESTRICDSRGNELKTGAQKALGIAGGILGAAGRLASWTVKGYASLVGGAIRGLGAIGGGVANGMGRFLSAFLPQGDWLDKFTRKKDDSPTKVLKDIYALLDERLAKPAGIRENSWQDQNAEREARKAEEKRRKEEDARAEREEDREQGFLSKMFGSLGGLFGGEGEEDGGGDDDTYIFGGGGGDGEGRRNERDARGRRRGGWRRNMRARWERGKRSLGRSRLGRMVGGANWGNRTGAGAAGIAGRGGGGGGILSRLKPRGFGLGGILSSIAMALGGSWAIDKLFGEGTDAADTANTVVNTGATAAGLYGMAGLGSTAAAAGTAGAATAGTAAAGTAAAGTAAAGTAAGVGAGGAAAGLGGSALVTIGLPVAIVAAAVGYAGYKAFKKYKYGTYIPLRAYRMAQYGIQYDNASQVEKIVDLEQLLEPHIYPTGAGYDIRSSEISMDNVYEMFDLDDGWFTSNENERRAFDAWFNNRFKPVFLSWKANLKNISQRVPLNDVDDSLEKEEKKSLLRSVRNLPANYFNTTVGPFDGEELDVQADDLENEYLKAMQEIEEGGGAMSTIRRLGSAAAAMSPVSFITSPLTDWSERMQRDRDAESLRNDPERMAQVVGTQAAVGATVGTAAAVVSITGQPNPTSTRSERVVSALKTIRMRAYGLSDLDSGKVGTLSYLETEAAKLITIDGSGAAKFDGNPDAFFRDFSGMFGIANSDAAARRKWVMWFQRRFVPTLLAYAGKVFSYKTGSNVFDVESGLTPEQRLEVGNAVAGASYSLAGMQMSVWSFTDNPWGGEPLNDDPHSVFSNLEALREARGKGATVAEQTSRAAGGRGDGTARNASKEGRAAATSKDPSIRERLSGMMGGAMNWLKGAGAGVMAGARSAWNSVTNFASGVGQGVSNAYKSAATVVSDAAAGVRRTAINTAVGAVGAIANTAPLVIRGDSKDRERSLIVEAIKAGISDPIELAMFLGQVAAETGHFRQLEENLNYRPEVAKRLWPRRFTSVEHAASVLGQGKPAFAEAIYGNRGDLGNTQPGDGYKYRGRGLIQLTGRHNYEQFSKWSGIDVVNNPDLVATDPRIAALTAVHYWKTRVQGRAQMGDINAVTRLINGGLNGLSHRLQSFNHYRQLFGSKSIQEIASKFGGSPNSVATLSGTPANGGSTTTTTANGPTGGVAPVVGAMSTLSSGATIAANPSGTDVSTMMPVSNRIEPTSTFTAPPAAFATASVGPQQSGVSPGEAAGAAMVQQREALLKNATATDFRNSEMNAEAARQLATVSDILKQQLTVQQAMAAKMAESVEILRKIDGKTVGMATGSQTGNLTANNSAPSSARGAKPAQALPNVAPVSMQRSTA